MLGDSPKKKVRFLEASFLIRRYVWKYKKWIGIGLLALVSVDLLEILPPLLIKQSIDIIIDHQPMKNLLEVAGIYVGVALLQSLGRYAWRMFLIRASILSGRDLRSEFVYHLFGLSISFFERRRLGDLMSLATNDVETVRMAVGTGLLVFADAVFYLVTVPVVMFILSPELTGITCFLLLFIPWIVLKNEKKIHMNC